MTWATPERTILAASARVVCWPAIVTWPLVEVEQPGDGPPEGGLAGTVGTEQRDDLSLRHGDRHAPQHEDDVVVDDLQVRHGQGRIRAWFDLRRQRLLPPWTSNVRRDIL